MEGSFHNVSEIDEALAPLSKDTGGKVHRIGVFVPGSVQTHGKYVTTLRNALKAVGYIEGNDHVLLVRWIDRRQPRFISNISGAAPTARCLPVP
jgi:hypothetical protein